MKKITQKSKDQADTSPTLKFVTVRYDDGHSTTYLTKRYKAELESKQK